MSISEKQLKELKKKGISDDILREADIFLTENKFELLYLTDLGAGEYRVMFRRPDGKGDARIFNYPN